MFLRTLEWGSTWGGRSGGVLPRRNGRCTLSETPGRHVSSQQKKQKHRLKRQQRQKQLRKARNQSPLQAIKPGVGELQFFISDNWKEFRQASIFALRQVQGTQMMAAFLVDQGIAGLKDAWVRFNVTAEEFDRIREECRQVSPLVSCTLDAARGLIAGAIRYAHDNGMRLPRDMDRALRVIDGVGDWRQADTKDFVPEFAGSMADLRARCVGQTVESVLARKDLTIIIDDGAPSLIDEDEEADDRANNVLDALLPEFESMSVDVAERVGAWCRERGEAGHPSMRSVITLHYMSIVEAQLTGADFDDILDRVLDTFAEATDIDDDAYNVAIQQLDAYVKADASHDAWIASQISGAIAAAKARIDGNADRLLPGS